jgi:hypothetical protein
MEPSRKSPQKERFLEAEAREGAEERRYVREDLFLRIVEARCRVVDKTHFARNDVP